MPDFSSRYFRADFAFGLKVIKDFALLVHEETPNIDHVWDWYLGVSGATETFGGMPADLDSLKALYA